MLNLKLEKKDTVNIPEPRNIKVVDVLIESRKSHNELVDAMSKIVDVLNDISLKLKDHPELQKSIEFNTGSISDVETKLMPALEAKMTANIKQVKADLLVKVDDNSDKIGVQEGHSRRRNVIVNGMPELENETIEEVAKGFLVNDLKMNSDQVRGFLLRDIHRLPRAKNRDGTERNTHRPIIMAFLKQKDRNDVMRNAFNLKDTDYSIKSDLPRALNELRGKMLKERSQLKTNNPRIRYRVTERSYRPVLQKEDGLIPGTTRIKWTDIKITL